MSDKPLSILQGRPNIGGVRTGWVAIRPRSLAASLGPLVLALGIAVSTGDVRPFAILPVLVGGILFQVGTNLANDYFDHRQGADDVLGRGESFSRPAVFLAGGAAAMAVALALGLDLVLRTGTGLLAFALGAAVFGFEYTAPPLRLNYRGLGEASVLLLLGPGLTLGAYYALTGTLSWVPALAGLPPGLLTSAVLFANNVRDIAPDEKSGKRTLAVRLGPRRASLTLAAQLVASEVLLLAFGAWGALPRLALIALISSPWAVVLALGLASGRIPPERVMGGAYGLGLTMALLMTAAFLLG